jgi:hypothetical protein
MKSIKTLATSTLITVFALLLGGCGASHQSRSMEIKDSLLINPAILEKGADDQALYRYVNPKADIKSYNKIMIDPVIMSKSNDLDASDTENYQKLVNNAFVLLNNELKNDYSITQNPEPGTLRVQMAIIEASSASKVRSVTSTILPIGLAINLVKYSATGKPSAVGDITVEIKITDAATGELLGAAVDQRVGGMNIAGAWDSWRTADDALAYWAKKVRFVLCEKRGKAACVKPE